MIERAAQAVREADGAYLMERTGGWMTEGGVVGDDHWVDLARAVIEALREPTGPLLEVIYGCSTTHDWRSMIDTVLGEEGRSPYEALP